MRILLIEDDEALCRVLQPSLQAAGFASDCCHSGADGLALLKTGCYDACILDRMLPELDGLQLLHQAPKRRGDSPGADADGPGPGGRPGGWAGRRSRRLPDQAFRHPGAAGPAAGAGAPSGGTERARPTGWPAGDLTLDTAQLTLTGPAATVTVSRRECDLLAVFCRAPGLLRGRALLLGSVWGADAGVEDASLDSYIRFVRRRLAAVGSRAVIRTVRGAGYRLDPGGAPGEAGHA